MIAVIVSIALNAATFIVLLILINRKMRREFEGGAAMDEIRDEINALVVELNHTTDRNVGIVEERLRRLQTLIVQADKKIHLLDREIEKHQIGIDVYDKLKSGARLKPTVEQPGVKPPQPQRVVAPNEVTTSPESLEVVEADEVVIQGALAEDVISLHRQGFDARIIAKRLGAAVGEVELILSLRGGGR